MHLEDASVEPTRLTLWGPGAALEVQHPLPGVLRLRHLPSLLHTGFAPRELPPKDSWAVVGGAPRPMDVREEGGLWRVSAGELVLEVQRGPCTWRLSDAQERVLARCEWVTGDAATDYPATRFHSRLALHAPQDEAYLGFGEKVGPLDKRGMRFVFWNTDVLPHHPDTDPLYQSIPFFLALRQGRAWGLFLDETWRSEVDVAAADPHRLVWESRGPELDVYVFAGPHPEDVVRRYTALTGHPPLPPLWSLGAQQSRWGYETADEVRSIIRGYRAHRLPLDCVYLDIDHMEAYKVFTWDRTRFPDPAHTAREAAEQGVRLVPIIDPAVKEEPGYAPWEEGRARDFFVRTDRGEVLLGDVWPLRAAYPDFTRPEVQAWWGGLHRGFLDAGMGGFWLDMNEPSSFALRNAAQSFKVVTGPATDLGRVEGPTLPYDARHGARRHLEVHNAYALGMANGTFEALRQLAPERRPFLLTRAGYAGIQRYAAVWTGDNSSWWTHLEASIPMLLGLGLSGVSFTGVDIPGFLGRATGELLVRWMQAAAFFPLFRNHSAKGTPLQEPWRFGEPYLSLAREVLELRYRVLPTLYTLMHEAAELGLPVLRPLVFHAPEDAEALHANDEYLVGRDLLVTPVVRPGQARRSVYVPRGRWLPLPNLGPPGSVREGPEHLLVEAPLGTLPLWLREGGVLAVTEPALHTTTALWPELTWHVHVGPEVKGVLYEDAGDGYGAARRTRLRGGTEGGRFVLERHVEGAVSPPRDTETLLLHGLTQPREVTGARAWDVEDGTLRVVVDAAWERIEVLF
ncbi:MAG: glycoside hydrolase family 31 protein [Myxococcaceae bacterium]|nr:glycoside hydrolase family 31 protein [Myxococcaceae bacterium]